MSIETVDSVPQSQTLAVRRQWPLALRLALRELRSGVGGFRLLIACLALGVGVIAAVGALSDALRAGFERQGERILGGDVTLARVHKRAEPSELVWLKAGARVSETATLRSMARTLDGNESALIELKGIDSAYPLSGDMQLKDGVGLDAAVRARRGAVIDPILMERLQIKVGDSVRIGSIEVPVTGVIASEPDTVSDRLTFGPRVMVSLATLEATGLVQPGTLIRWRYALKLKTDASNGGDLAAFRESVRRELPEAGFVVADRRDPSPQITRTLDRLRQFLTLIGLTALLIGGVGVANAVATFIDRRRKVIATMRSLGATSRQVLSTMLAQILLIAAIGIGLGLAIGYAVPLLLNVAYGDALPIRTELRITPLNVISASLYGLLVALLFTLWPLGRAERIRAGALFRDDVVGEDARPPLHTIIATTIVGALLLALAVFTADAWKLALYFCLGIMGTFAIFIALGHGVTFAARRLPRPAIPEIALALGNLGGPGGLTRAVVLSLGSGLTLLVAVALVDASLVNELTSRVPKQSPNYFVLDVDKSERADLERIVRRVAPEAIIQEAPMLRGRLVRLNDQLVETVKAPPEAQWVLNGDRGLTYAEDVPPGSRVIDGAWWPKDYSGEPLVSFERDLARNLKLKVGDTVTVNVLGRNVTARIASLREVKWESLAINFVLVFSPNTLKAAPHKLLATVTLAEGTPLSAEAEVARDIGRQLPGVTSIRVKDAINSFNAVFAKIMVAVRAAGGVTLLAGALVLAGALATAQRRRIKQAVILKALGATRNRILASHAAEYLLLSLVTAGLAVVLGSLVAWVVVSRVMAMEFILSPWAVAQALGIALALVMVFGSIGTWQVLRAPTVPHLRSE